MKIEVLEDRLAVRLVDPETTTASGIVLPDVAAGGAAHQEGEVVAAGPDVVDQLAVGAKVICSKYAGTEMEVDGEKLLIVKQPDVLAVLPS